MQKKTAQRAVPIAIAVGVVAVGAIVAFGQSDRKEASSGIEVNRDRASAPSVAVTKSESARKPLSFYVASVRKDLFSAPEPQKPKPDTKPVPKVEAPPAPTPPPVVVNPFADYVYSGTVQMGGRTMALVENSKTKEGLYLSTGDPFMGGKVADVGDRLLTIDVAGRQELLAKRDDFKLTPLDKSAPFLQGGPAPGAPGAPGAPTAAPGAPPSGGPQTPSGMQGFPRDFQDRFRQRMQNMSPEQRQRMEERMNQWRDRQFEGGNRRREGGGERRRERRNNDG